MKNKLVINKMTLAKINDQSSEAHAMKAKMTVMFNIRNWRVYKYSTDTVNRYLFWRHFCEASL